MKPFVMTSNSDTSSVIYGLIEQAFAYCRNMAVIAGIATIANMVSSHPGFFFRLNFNNPVLMLLSLILGASVLGSSALFAHKSRALISARVGAAWTPGVNRAFMWGVAWPLNAAGTYFIYETLLALSKLRQH